MSLWRCPACGQTFVARNMPHSCAVVGVEAFFSDSAPELRELFDRFVAAVGAPVVVNATKSRIALQAQMRFAGIDRPRRRHLVASFVLTRPIDSARLTRVDYVPPYYYVHRLRLAAPADVDAELEAWLHEAHQVGERRHVEDPGWHKQRRPPEWVHVPRGVAVDPSQQAGA